MSSFPVATLQLGQKWDDDDIHSAALCAWKEARGEGNEGMLGVLWVLKNRVGFTGFAHSLHDVIYGKNQFTSMSVPSDPEFNLAPDVWAADHPQDKQAWDAAKELAGHVFKGVQAGYTLVESLTDDPDITNGAHYYANLHNVTSGWFMDNIVKNSTFHPITAQIGKHTFFA